MGELILFKPKAQQAAGQNLAAFMAMCRDQLTVFGSDLDWNADVWKGVVTFAKLGVSTRKPASDQVMDKGFIEFAKAYFRYQQGHKPTGTKNEGKALRALEAALLQVNGNAAISGLSIAVLDEAAQLAKQYYSAAAAYHCGREIERLAEFVSENKLVSTGLEGWRNPIKRFKDQISTGKDAKKAREKKLPEERALNALAEVFANDPAHGRDVFTTSIFAMLMSSPSRISEVLALPVDCEVTEKDSKGKERYGWRFFAGKGYDGDIKWIPTEMVGVTKIAVARAKGLSESARRLAVWVEEHPDSFYRHPDCPDVADDIPLTMEQACQALGLACETRRQCTTSLANRKLATKERVHTLNSLWQHVMGRLPKDFPWFDRNKGIKYSNALFALNSNQFHGNRGRSPVELDKPTANFFNNDLGLREGVEGHRNFFDRHGYLDEDGGRSRMTSHQPRHLLNTIAQRGGLSNLEIAKWSGRADVTQNRTYNHMTEYELVARAERLDISKELFGPAGEVAKHLPVSSQEFNTLAHAHAAAHVTEYGFCVHDYTMSPCEKYRDCVNCTEHVCIKGDGEKLKRLKDRLAKSERLLALAQQAIQEGDMGADRWYQYHEKTVMRLRELVGILENPEREDGIRVKLRGNDFSQLRRVAEKKSLEAINQQGGNDGEAALLKDLTAMLGGGFG